MRGGKAGGVGSKFAEFKVTRMSLPRPVPAMAMTLFFAGYLLADLAAPASAQGLAAHRAVYDLKLARAAPSSGVSHMTGRLVFEFLGDSCSGYVVNMRWVNRLFEEDGTGAVSDLRSSTWEAADGGAFGFNSTHYIGSSITETTRGMAHRAGGREVAVELDAPVEKIMSFEGEVAFPTQHMLALIKAARAGRRILQKRVFDGSEDGDKVYETTAVIGAAARPDHGEAEPLGAGQLKGLLTWPVTVAYFDIEVRGEAQPVYQHSFTLYENGVSDSLLLDFGDVALEGELRDIEFLPEADCP